mgnify:CR=1 FL=1
MQKTELNELYDKWIQPIYRYTLSRVKHVDDAKDITSQTFLSAWQHRERYQERGEFTAWLFSIARNKINDHFRQARRKRNTIQTLGDDEIYEVSAEPQHETLIALRQVVNTLSEKEQELIRLRYVAGLDFASIAKISHRSQVAIRKACSRLVTKLKAHFEQEQE